jgi:hypothetical protein
VEESSDDQWRSYFGAGASSNWNYELLKNHNYLLNLLVFCSIILIFVKRKNNFFLIQNIHIAAAPTPCWLRCWGCPY